MANIITMPNERSFRHKYYVNFTCDEDLSKIAELGKNGPIGHVPKLDNKLRGEIGHGSVFIFNKLATGIEGPNAWNDGRKWEPFKNGMFMEEREVGVIGEARRLHKKVACYDDKQTGKHWIVVYFEEGREKELLVPPPGVEAAAFAGLIV